MCARALPQGLQSQVRSSRLVELRSQPVAKREQNLAKCWSEWQDLNLRPLVPNEVRYQSIFPRSASTTPRSQVLVAQDEEIDVVLVA